MNQTILRKLTSRKFWLAVAAFATEMILAFRGEAQLAETVSGCIMAGAAVIAYIIGEGLTDAANTVAVELPQLPDGDSSLKEGAERKLEEK